MLEAVGDEHREGQRALLLVPNSRPVATATAQQPKTLIEAVGAVNKRVEALLPISRRLRLLEHRSGDRQVGGKRRNLASAGYSFPMPDSLSLLLATGWSRHRRCPVIKKD